MPDNEPAQTPAQIPEQLVAAFLQEFRKLAEGLTEDDFPATVFQA
jgi:hypothetical protein